jgi:hypothetical protein
MNQDLLLSAPKVKRTHCYVQKPFQYQISCPLCDGFNVEWSEFEKHIWCNECKKDVFISLGRAGIFSGPLPINIAQMMGYSFDRINIETGAIVKFDESNTEQWLIWNNSWVRDEDLDKFESNFK